MKIVKIGNGPLQTCDGEKIGSSRGNKSLLSDLETKMWMKECIDPCTSNKHQLC